MNIGEAIRIAVASLWANKLRSVLTLLGVVIGIAAVIAVVTFVAGINGYVAERILRLGPDVVLVGKMSNVIRSADEMIEQQKRKDITMDEYRALTASCSLCKSVGASTFNGSGHVASDNQSTSDTWIRGLTPSMGPILDVDVVNGRFLNETDVENAAPVAVIGNDVLEKLLGGGDPIGHEIRVDGRMYTVIGVGKKEGKTLGQSRDNYVIIPISSWMRQYGSHVSVRLAAKAQSMGMLDPTIDQVRAIIRAQRHDLPGKPDSFALETNASFMSIWSNLSGSFFIVMIAIASISLVVGGIVIMNIMLVSVTERTREIGIRKALGARRSDVLNQFLIEAVTVALVGGILGVAFGIGIAKGVTALIGMPSAIPLWAIGAGIGVSASVGVFFGVYPASKASRLDPIAALRFEL